MKKLIGFLILSILLFGCTTNPIGPKHDEVLIYNKSYDYTYLKVLEAINDTPSWNIRDTDKEAGVITAWNDSYESLFDADKRQAVFYVKRLESKKTSVELAPQSQTIIGIGEVMKSIDTYMGKYRKEG
ncbi:MAG: hypothetical protein PHE61_05150 [Candidatus Omnitrophica bacterium]|nr:hypothetical protein [Candidatus Omnitrophota bacterium]